MDHVKDSLPRIKLPELKPAAGRVWGKPDRTPFATEIQISGDPFDPRGTGSIIKPRELVDRIEITPLTRLEEILFNQLLANAWQDIREPKVHRIAKSELRGSHESNDRLDDAFDTLMTAYVKIRALDPQTGKLATIRLHLLGSNKEEDARDGYFHYTFPEELLTVMASSRAWASIKTHIMYAMRSKYSLRLYEMVERRAGMIKAVEEISLEDLRGMMGVPEGKLTRYPDLRKYCIKVAVAEVNHLSDFTVSLTEVKKGRQITSFVLSWIKKSGKALELAAAEREKSRVGRQARWSGKTEIIFEDDTDAARPEVTA